MSSDNVQLKTGKTTPPQSLQELQTSSETALYPDNDQAMEQLRKKLLFEELLSEISTEYTNLPPDQVDATIESGLQRAGIFFGADRCNLAQFAAGKRAVRMLHSWVRSGFERLPDFLVGPKTYFPWTMEQLLRGTVVQFTHPNEFPAEAEMDRNQFLELGTCSQVALPISVGGLIVGALALDTIDKIRKWSSEEVGQLKRLGEIFANAVLRKEKELEIQQAFSEIKQLKEQIEADYSYLRQEIELEHNPHNMIGQCAPFKQMIFKVQQVAPTDITVLILGETGTGKELVARAIHDASRRKDRPMVKVNCAALPTNLIESELFGHEKGAFTSAQARQIGRFELANGSTIFLDEIGELPLESQAKMLRVLQEGEFERLGSGRTTRVDVRIIAATNRNLEEEVKKGRFREDLWYRLNVFPITSPPLRERQEDIPLLVNWLVHRFNRKLGRDISRVSTQVMKKLQSYPWPGNIRELENVVERATISSPGHSLQLLDPLDTPSDKFLSTTPFPPLEEVERNHIIQALQETGWRVHGPQGAALLLGLHPSTLRFRMRKLGIVRSMDLE